MRLESATGVARIIYRDKRQFPPPAMLRLLPTQAVAYCLLLFTLVSLLPAVEKADFARDVQPILHARCSGCHGQEKPQVGLSVYTRAGLLKGGLHGPAITPRSSGTSLLIARISGGAVRMPLGQPPLSAEEISVLRAWIDAGAEWNPSGAPLQGQSLIAPRRPPVPPSGETNPIDAFLASYSKKKGLTVPPLVSDSVFARRAYLDLVGLPPAPEEQDAFTQDSHPEKRGRLIDALLHDRTRYAAHWITLWNDLLRNDEGVAYPGETREWITGWLLQALETNLPYDRMVQSLLNPVATDAPRGFLKGVNWGGDVSASQSIPMQAAQNSAQVFLGANLKCASCHDSFVSHWKLAQTFALAAFFSATPLELARCEIKTGAKAEPAFLFPEMEQAEPEAASLPGNARAAKLFTSPKNGRFARTLVNRYWRVLMGQGLVEPVDDMDAPAWSQDLLDWLASDFADHHYDLQFLLRRIMTSRAYQTVAASEPEPAATGAVITFRGPLHRRLTAEQFTDAVASITGEWKLLDKQTGKPATYERQWRFRSDPLTRALGRSERSQVITTRTTEATTLQALELVNGEQFAGQLRRAAQRLRGEAPKPMENIFDSGLIRNTQVTADVDITGVDKLWLLIEDLGSYDRPKVLAGWMDAAFSGPQGTVRLMDLPLTGGSRIRSIRMKDAVRDAITGPVPMRISYDLSGKGFTRFRAVVGVDEASQRPETTAKVRFFLFTKEPAGGELVRIADSAPAPAPPRLMGDALVTRLYRHALARDPNAIERREAAKLVAQGAPGLEDLLWILFLSPEFQVIR